MRRSVMTCVTLGGSLFLLAAMAVQNDAVKAQSAPVTFTKHVEPLLLKHCQTCHRPGEVAPMSFLTCESTRPWARAIKAAVEARKMPPWFADPQHGRFSNDRSMTAEEIATFVAWADTGAAMGNPADVPRGRALRQLTRQARQSRRDRGRLRRHADVGGDDEPVAWDHRGPQRQSRRLDHDVRQG